MRVTVAAAAALLAACGPKASPHTSQAPPPALTCDNVVVAPVPDIDGMVQDLGTAAVGTQMQFTVPAGTAAFFIVAQAVGTSGDAILNWGGAVPNVVVPRLVQGPSGTLYDDLVTPPTTTISGLRYQGDFTGALAEPGFDAAVGVFSFPNTSGALRALASAGSVVEEGTWSLTVSDWAYECVLYSGGSCTGGNTSGQYHVYVVTRPTPTTTPTLDVEVYLATDSTGSVLPTVDAANASARVARWKQSLTYYLGKAGVTLGAVTFNGVPASVKARYAPNGAVDVGSSGPCSDLSQLFTSAVVPSRGVNVFLADDLIAPAIGQGFVVAGVDGSIPGPSGFPGTVNSGAIVGLENFEFEQFAGACSAGGPPNLTACGTDRTAYITAHEIGHWLGLFHVTEAEGTFFDPLSDTSVCPCHACAAAADQSKCTDFAPSASPATLIDANQCVSSAGCGGGDNLMFWAVSDAHSTGALSPDQAQVMRLNPAVH